MNKKVLLSVLSAGLLATSVAPLALAQGENASNSNQLTQKKYVSWRDAADEAEKQVNAHMAEIKAEAAKEVVSYKTALDSAKDALAKYNPAHQNNNDVTGRPSSITTNDGRVIPQNPYDKGRPSYQGAVNNSQEEAAYRAQLQEAVTKAQAAYDKAFNEAFTTVRNKYRAQFEENYIKAAQAQGNWYNETPTEANRTNAERIAADIEAQTGKRPTVETKKDGSVVIKDEKGNVLKTVTRDGKVVNGAVKGTKKVLPKTHAAK